MKLSAICLCKSLKYKEMKIKPDCNYFAKAPWLPLLVVNVKTLVSFSANEISPKHMNTLVMYFKMVHTYIRLQCKQNF